MLSGVGSFASAYAVRLSITCRFAACFNALSGVGSFASAYAVRLSITCRKACFNVLSGVGSFASAYAVRLLYHYYTMKRRMLQNVVSKYQRVDSGSGKIVQIADELKDFGFLLRRCGAKKSDQLKLILFQVVNMAVVVCHFFRGMLLGGAGIVYGRQQ